MEKILDTLRTLYETRPDEIEAWLGEKRAEAEPFVTTSVDLRHSGLRLAPVDTNLFPAGFNNLSPAAVSRSVSHMKSALGEAKKVLIVPESHTRNMAYLESLAVLKGIAEQAGFEVQLGSLTASNEPLVLTAPSGSELIESPLKLNDSYLETDKGFRPEVVLLNNDLTSGRPELLAGIKQPVLPPIGMGWWQRRKSEHFTAYRALVEDFGKAFGLDPWLLAAEFHCCGKVDFKAQTGLDCMAKGVEKVLGQVREKYKAYGISDDPYVYVKADSGTYGMGIMTVKSPEEVFEMNKKTRNKMQVIKEGAVNHEVIIQEGIPTVDVVDGKVAEPMVYLVDGIPVGGMYRVNAARDQFNNLNAAGMEFTGMCDQEETSLGRHPVKSCDFRSFGLVAAIAALAAPREKYGEQESSKQACK